MKFKNILLISAGVFIIIMALLYFFVFPKNNEVGPITIEAQQLTADKKYEEALQLLIEKKNELDPTGENLLSELQAEIYPILLEEAQKLETEKDYILAYEKYQKLYVIAPNENIEVIEDKLRDLEQIVNEIKELEAAYEKYMLTFEEALYDSNVLLKEFKANLDKFEVGLLKPEGFSKVFTSKIDASNEILNKLDSALSINNKDLLSIHKNVVNLMNKQHNMILESLKVKAKEADDSIRNFKQTYLDIKENQIVIIQELNTFAVNNNLKIVTISETSQNSGEDVKEQKNKDKVDQDSVEITNEKDSITKEESGTTNK